MFRFSKIDRFIDERIVDAIAQSHANAYKVDIELVRDRVRNGYRECRQAGMYNDNRSGKNEGMVVYFNREGYEYLVKYGGERLIAQFGHCEGPDVDVFALIFPNAGYRTVQIVGQDKVETKQFVIRVDGRTIAKIHPSHVMRIEGMATSLHQNPKYNWDFTFCSEN